MLDLSPFAHVPHLPGAAPFVALTVVAVVGAAGPAGFRRRDVPTT